MTLPENDELKALEAQIHEEEQKALDLMAQLRVAELLTSILESVARIYAAVMPEPLPPMPKTSGGDQSDRPPVQ